MSDYVPIAGGSAFTYTASAAITGGQVVEATGNGTVGPAGSQSTKVVGVAGYDAASGALLTVYDRDMVHRTNASAAGAVTAGQSLRAGASGTVEPFVNTTDKADMLIGQAIVGAAANQPVTWKGC